MTVEYQEIESYLAQYQAEIHKILTQKKEISISQILSVLNSRDQIETVLHQSTALTADSLQKLAQLDAQLKHLADAIVDASVRSSSSQFADWRMSFHPAPAQWWWYLDQRKTIDPHPWDALDGIWRALTITGWTVNISLLVDIGSRFFASGAGVAGASTVVFSTLITLLKARTELTDAGKEGFEKLLRKLKIPQHFHEEVRVGSTLVLSAGLFSLWFALPNISQLYNQTGLKSHRKGDIGIAEQHYERAIAIDPNNAQAHYNLGLLYEDLQQLDQAQSQYLTAIQGKIPNAYNRLAYLLLKQGNVDAAISFLEKSLLNNETILPEVKYELYTYLGWARLIQEHWAEAEDDLKIAIEIAQQPGVSPYVQNPASAHCLLAQVFDTKGEDVSALEHWLICCQLGNRFNLDEDQWIQMARKRLGENTDQCTVL